jgi:hypothetical protein
MTEESVIDLYDLGVMQADRMDAVVAKVFLARLQLPGA